MELGDVPQWNDSLVFTLSIVICGMQRDVREANTRAGMDWGQATCEASAWALQQTAGCCTDLGLVMESSMRMSSYVFVKADFKELLFQIAVGNMAGHGGLSHPRATLPLDIVFELVDVLFCDPWCIAHVAWMSGAQQKFKLQIKRDLIQ